MTATNKLLLKIVSDPLVAAGGLATPAGVPFNPLSISLLDQLTGYNALNDNRHNRPEYPIGAGLRSLHRSLNE